MQRFQRYRFILVVLFVSVSACTSTAPVYPPQYVLSETLSYTPISGEAAEDADITGLLKPYRSKLEMSMNRVIGEAKDDLTRGKPESTLGNMASDAVRFIATEYLGTFVHVGLVNVGGLRTNITKGDITVGNIFEVMPFENKIIVLEMTGTELKLLADEIAETGGEPISGMRMRIVDGKAKDVLVASKPVVESETYLLATNTYLADGGGAMPVLWGISRRNELPILIRDALIKYVSDRGVISPMIDGRLRQ